MIRLVTLNQAIKAFFKVIIAGNDTIEANNYQNAGIDSKPIKDRRAIMVDTQSSTRCIIGFEQKSDKTKEGETRVYAEKGSAEVFLNGSGEVVVNEGTGYAMDYTSFNLKMIEMQALINVQLTAISVGIVGAGGSYTPVALNVDYSSAKVDKLRL